MSDQGMDSFVQLYNNNPWIKGVPKLSSAIIKKWNKLYDEHVEVHGGNWPSRYRSAHRGLLRTTLCLGSSNNWETRAERVTPLRIWWRCWCFFSISFRQGSGRVWLRRQRAFPGQGTRRLARLKMDDKTAIDGASYLARSFGPWSMTLFTMIQNK